MSEDYKVQVTISLPPVAQYAKGDMVNFRGNDIDEVYNLLNDALDGDTTLFEKAAEAAKVYLLAAGLDAKTESVAQGGNGGSNSGGPDVRTCAHGKMEYKSGNGRKGPWAGYFCSERDKSRQCDVQWVSDK